MNIETLQSICKKLPACQEDIKWGNDLCFTIGAKMFCVAGLTAPLSFSFKVSDEEYEELSQSAGFSPAPYMAKNKWVLVTDPTVRSKKEWESYIRKSYEMISSKLSKKLQKELGIL